MPTTAFGIKVLGGSVDPGFVAPVAGTPGTAGTGNAVRNVGRGVFVHVKNGSGGVVTATIIGRGTLADGTVIPNKAFTVPAGGERIFGPVNPGLYNDANGEFEISFSAITSVTMSVYEPAQ